MENDSSDDNGNSSYMFCFWLMPILWGVPGIWLAVPVSELLTFLFVITIYCRRKRS